jgi:hypothetical protein
LKGARALARDRCPATVLFAERPVVEVCEPLTARVTLRLAEGARPSRAVDVRERSAGGVENQRSQPERSSAAAEF